MNNISDNEFAKYVTELTNARYEYYLKQSQVKKKLELIERQQKVIDKLIKMESLTEEDNKLFIKESSSCKKDID